MRQRTTFLRFVLSATLVIVGLPGARLFAADSSHSRSKTSPDLIQPRRDKRVSVIVQFNSSSPTIIDSILNTLGARVTRRLNAINMRALDLPLGAVLALASQKEVRFLSPDRQIASFGHLETTTGTADARVQTTTAPGGLTPTSTTYD